MRTDYTYFAESFADWVLGFYEELNTLLPFDAYEAANIFAGLLPYFQLGFYLFFGWLFVKFFLWFFKIN